ARDHLRTGRPAPGKGAADHLAIQQGRAGGATGQSAMNGEIRRHSKFRSAAILTVLALAFAALVALGTWQVQRLHWKEGLIQTIEQRIGQAPVPLAHLQPLIDEGGALEYTPVSVSGTFLHEQEMYFFATHAGQSGWFVYTPLVMAQGEGGANHDTVIVNRG